MHWLEDYALFRALKARYNGAYYLEWPAELVRRAAGGSELGPAGNGEPDRSDPLCAIPVVPPGRRLKEHARAKGMRMIGDLPFFVSPDSSDVWANPELFLLDEQHRPRFVAGVPPDYFSATGQLWGNPVYDWDASVGPAIVVDRPLACAAGHVDIIRLDHFRAFAAAWHVPAGAATARTGQWVPGPGADFFSVIAERTGQSPVHRRGFGPDHAGRAALRDQFRVPGMRVLQFAFDGDAG